MFIRYLKNISFNVANSSNGATSNQKKWLGAMMLATVTCVMISVAMIAFPGIQADFFQKFCDLFFGQDGRAQKITTKIAFISVLWMPIAFFWAALGEPQKDKIIVGKRSALLGVVFGLWFFALIFGSIYMAIALDEPLAALTFQVVSLIVLSLNSTCEFIRKNIDK